MTTRQTPDAVREGLFASWSTKTLADQCHMQAREHLDPEFTQFMTAVGNRLAALDSRAGDAVPAGEVERLREVLRAVRDDLHNENGLNLHSITDTIWHGPAETTVDFIDAALSHGEGRE
ncbi:hypothetical protein ACQKJZ_17625 [Sphingomonas sp. NPDC019816]|uniref:hypothetical protein n=1 Tax=Sphingomonas sp. NPDC019816 TaxID=3390679 RepID=UPI003D04357A